MNTLCRYSVVWSVLLIIVVAVSGCATTPMDKSEAKASTEVPEQSEVEVATLDYDPSLPTFVVAIEPFDYSASGQTSGGGQAAPMGNPSASGSATTTVADDGTITTTWGSSASTDIGVGISKQLITTLSRWGNVSIIDNAALQHNDDGTYTCNLTEGEVGPFIIRGTVTEFTETADASGKSRGGSLGVAGAIAGIAGGIAGSNAVRNVGAGVAAANPTMREEEMKRTGMVGLDLQLLDGRNARIVRGYTASGTFTSMSKVRGTSLFGIGSTDSEFAASSLGQATRAAMNEALMNTSEALRIVAARQQ